MTTSVSPITVTVTFDFGDDLVAIRRTLAVVPREKQMATMTVLLDLAVRAAKARGRRR